ncbi:MAG: choline dehydrogenase [Chitinophagales bacterium]|nr:choline dehydrogenase [Chitinophagales bacterium]
MYDYIIVGAGSAGCVLAARLTEDPSTKVLLLEAGGADKEKKIHIPVGFPQLFKTDYDWAYHTTEQQALLNRQIYVPRGKVMGGSSSLNAMIYIRGNKEDYDDWERAGNKGWSFNDVLPYFKKAEDQQRGPSELHGVGGPMAVTDPISPNILSKLFLKAVTEVGQPLNDDLNGPKQDGFALVQRNIKNGKRVSSAVAYLKPSLQRPNLTVVSHAHVTNLLWEGKRVTGIEYERGDKRHIENCTKEVILSAGAINTPQIMMLSGLGPGQHLMEMGIPVVHDLPGVGQNLQDHPFVMLVARSKKDVTLDNAENTWNILRYYLFKNGPLTSTVAEACGFVHSRQGLPAPDLQIFFAPAFMVDHGFTRPEGSGFSLGPCLVKPKSRGAVTLKTPNYKDHPNIDPKFLTQEEDMAAMVEGYKVAAKLLHTKTFLPFFNNYYSPLERLHSVGEIMQFVREKMEAMYHPTGTCKMGTDNMAVVGPDLKVHGVEGLRVVDASIMPDIVRGNTNAPTIMIAEKAADIIRAEKRY